MQSMFAMKRIDILINRLRFTNQNADYNVGNLESSPDILGY